MNEKVHENPPFSERLRALQRRRRVSCRVLGELCGVSKSAMGHYLNGEREPTLRMLVLLADYFDVSVDHLLGRKNF